MIPLSFNVCCFIVCPRLRECALTAAAHRAPVHLPLDCVSCLLRHRFFSGSFLVTSVSQETLAEISPDSRLRERTLPLAAHRASVHLPLDCVSRLLHHRFVSALVLCGHSVARPSRQKLARNRQKPKKGPPRYEFVSEGRLLRRTETRMPDQVWGPLTRKFPGSGEKKPGAGPRATSGGSPRYELVSRRCYIRSWPPRISATSSSNSGVSPSSSSPSLARIWT